MAYSFREKKIEHKIIIGRRRQLIESIEVEVTYMASVSKDVFFHVSKFLEKMVFQLIFEIIK